MLNDSHDPKHDPGRAPGHDPGPRRQLVAALVMLGLLLAGGLWLTGALRGAARIQDCVQSGRTNCAPVDAPARSGG